MHDQLNDYFDKILSKYQCGFRKGFSTQHCSLAIIENLVKSFESGRKFQLKRSDLSKAFDYLFHDLLIANLHDSGI